MLRELEHARRAPLPAAFDFNFEVADLSLSWRCSQGKDRPKEKSEKSRLPLPDRQPCFNEAMSIKKRYSHRS
jgi:hypothetical protein